MIGHGLDGDSGKRVRKIDFQKSETRLVGVLEKVRDIYTDGVPVYGITSFWVYKDRVSVRRFAVTSKNTKYTRNTNVGSCVTER